MGSNILKPANPLVILGSARKESETKKFLNQVLASVDHKSIDLTGLHLSPYNYSGSYPPEDQFTNIVDELLLHDTIIFATPVYWYAMSGLMKTLFDRFTDLVTIKKQQGRQLKGKSTLLLAVGADEQLPEGFEVPFIHTSHYLGMNYRGSIYASAGNPPPAEIMMQNIQSFIAKITER